MRKLLHILILILFVSIAGIVTAQDTDDLEPLDPDYNWCFDDDVWGNSDRCIYPPEFHDLQWCHFQFGWYLPRVLRGDLTLEDVLNNLPCDPEIIADVVEIKEEKKKKKSYCFIPNSGKWDIYVLPDYDYVTTVDSEPTKYEDCGID